MPKRIRGGHSASNAESRLKQYLIVGLVLVGLIFYSESRRRSRKPPQANIIQNSAFNDPGMGTGPSPPPELDLKKATAKELAGHLCDNLRLITSLQCVTSGELALIAGETLASHRETVYNFRTSPPGLSRTVVDARLGTVKTVVDGKNLYVYLGSTGKFTRRDVHGRLNDYCEEVIRDAPELFSPVTIFAGKELPLGFGSPERKPDEREGEETFAVLSVKISDDHAQKVARQLVPNTRYSNVVGMVKVWINTSTGAIRRWSASLDMLAPPSTAKSPTSVQMRMTENVTRYSRNIVLPEREFVFTPPKGSQEVTAGATPN